MSILLVVSILKIMERCGNVSFHVVVACFVWLNVLKIMELQKMFRFVSGCLCVVESPQNYGTGKTFRFLLWLLVSG